MIAAGPGQSTALAQGATPVADEGLDLLFVQSFGRGTVSATDGDGGYTLTLEQGLGETVYFSDRPNRVVGTVADSAFITVFDLTDADPPNAALVSGDFVLVVELSGATVDEASGSLTYMATPIGQEDVDLHLDVPVSDAPAEDMTLDTCHLFIDSIDQCCDPTLRPWCC
jgi:hypothetical protein